VAKGKRRSKGSRVGADEPSSQPNPVLAGVAARMAEVIHFVRAGHWHAPSAGEDPGDRPAEDDDDGGLAASGVRKMPPDKSGSGSAALSEPDD
jgi:hypothetical protein